MPNVSRKTGCNSPMEPLTQFLLGLLINAVISVVLGFVSGCGGAEHDPRAQGRR